MIEDSLTEAGFAAVVADSACYAIALLNRTRSEPVALVTDIRLREGSGWDVGAAARSRFPSLPVIYTSGDSGGEWTARAVRPSVCLQKPVAGRTIAETVAGCRPPPVA